MNYLYEGNLVGIGLKIGIVVGCFNEFIIGCLFSGVEDVFKCYGVVDEDVDVVWVLGVYEILLIVKKLVEFKKYDVVIMLGIVIWGVILYFDFVCNEVVKGVVF